MDKKNSSKRVAVYLRVGTREQVSNDSKQNVKVHQSKEGGK